MSLPDRFNIRVYGIWIHEGRLLVNEEDIKGRKIIKFPGGGLEFGEGIMDCLKREWKEELNLDIDTAQHYYTTDFYQASAFDNSQVISVYYKVTVKTIPKIIVNSEPNELAYWVSLSELKTDTFTLPIDRVVGQMLAQDTFDKH